MSAASPTSTQADGSLAPASANPPDAAALAFPPPRELPPRPPADPTPEAVIDAFHRLVRDPALSYRAEGNSRWVFDGTELTSSLIIARSGGDLHIEAADAAQRGEAVLVDGSAASRLGNGEWTATDASLVRSFEYLSAALVIADLGVEPGGAGYRLLLEGGFDGVPQGSIGSADGRPSEVATEIVVDEAGRPQSVVFHRWDPLAPDAEDATEGVAVFAFANVGEPVEIPPLPIQPGEPPIVGSPAQLVTTALPAGDLSVELPAPVEQARTDLTLYDVDRDPVPLPVDHLVAGTAQGLRFEAGVAALPATGLVGDALLNALRSAIVGHTPGGDLRGYRPVTVGGVAGQEFTSDTYDSQIPPRATLLRARIVIIGDRAVLLSVVGPHALVASAEADRFLASLVDEPR